MRDSQRHSVTSRCSSMTKTRKARYFQLVLALYLLGMATLTVSVYAQEQSHRNVKKQFKPEYPALARRMGIHGTVKIEVTITPEGKVKSARVVGGSPALLEASKQAAILWEFDVDSKITSQIIEFKFAGSE
jgi:TonB family protein